MLHILIILLCRHMLLSASLWKPSSYDPLHVLLQTWFQTLISFLDLECVSVLRCWCQFAVVFLSDSVKRVLVCDCNCHSCAIGNLVVWSWSFRPVLHVQTCAGGCRLLTFLANNSMHSWVLSFPHCMMWRCLNVRLNGAASRTGGDGKMDGNITWWNIKKNLQ